MCYYDQNGNYICNGACSQLAAQNKTNTLSSLSNLQRGTYFPQNAILQQAQMGAASSLFNPPIYLGKVQCEIKIGDFIEGKISFEHCETFLLLNMHEKKIDNLDLIEYLNKIKEWKHKNTLASGGEKQG